MNLQNLIVGQWRDLILVLLFGFFMGFPFGRWTMKRSMRISEEYWVNINADYLAGLEEGFARANIREMEAEA